MQSGNHRMRDQREPDLVRSLKSPMVFSAQVSAQRATNPKLMTISSGKPQSSIYNNRFPNPSIFAAKGSPTHEGASAFSVPRSSAFNRVAALQPQVAARRKEDLDKSRGQVVWQPSSNEQVYRMAHIQQPANGSIIQIPQMPTHHPSFFIDQPSVSTPFYSFNSVNSQNVPLVINSNINGYLNSRPSILRKVANAKPPPPPPPPPPHDHNGQSSSYHGEVFKGLNRQARAATTAAVPAPNDPYIFCDSPRKKPRKQVVVAHEDSYASNVPEVVPAVETKPVVEDTISFYPPPCRRMTLLPSSSKVPPGRVVNHFDRYTDVKARKKRNFHEPVPEASYIASQGWRLLHLRGQLDELVTIQRENRAKICEFREYFCSLEQQEEGKRGGTAGGSAGGSGGSGSGSSSPESLGELVQKITQCCHTNGSQMKQAVGALDKLVTGHKPRVLELVRELKDRSNMTTTTINTTTGGGGGGGSATPVTRRKRTPPPKKEASSKKKTRKRKT